MNREEIYDNEINPLMAKVIALSKKHKIPMFATFQLNDQEGEEDFYCTTLLAEPDAMGFVDTNTFDRLPRVVKPEEWFMTETVATQKPSSDK